MMPAAAPTTTQVTAIITPTAHFAHQSVPAELRPSGLTIFQPCQRSATTLVVVVWKWHDPLVNQVLVMMIAELQAEDSTGKKELILKIRDRLPVDLRHLQLLPCNPSATSNVSPPQAPNVGNPRGSSSATVEHQGPWAPPRKAVNEVEGWIQQTAKSPWSPIAAETLATTGKFKPTSSTPPTTFSWILHHDESYVKWILEQGRLVEPNLKEMLKYFQEHYQRKPGTMGTMGIRTAPPTSLYEEKPECGASFSPGGKEWLEALASVQATVAAAHT